MKYLTIASATSLLLFGVFIEFGSSHNSREEDTERWMHPVHNFGKLGRQKQLPPVEDADFWVRDAQQKLLNKLEKPMILEKEAKNVIFYLGDGMSVPTVTAARILKGQKVDNLTFGEEAELHMDSFPFIGTSKTFCSDVQVADSACSATAYLCGSKGNDGTIGVTPNVLRRNCTAQANELNHVSSVLQWAQMAGKSTGVITTTRITHASPSGAYAHIADRDWENDGRIIDHGENSTLCDDIAEQLILREPGNKIEVILGGGRQQFIPNTEEDIEWEESHSPNRRYGFRRDSKHLIDQWISSKNPTNSKYITSKEELLSLNPATTDFVLGLFSPDHLGYLDQQEADKDPSLEDMVRVAISILKKNPKGFFLFVEGGRIDHAHHDNLVQRSLFETIEFDKAIQAGDELTEDTDTLLLVTSDHAHVMHFAGYPYRGNPILEYPEYFVNDTRDGLPYSTLGYANGPGQRMYDASGQRHDITGDDFESKTYTPPNPVPMASETHGGDDVLIFAKGPYAHLLTGVNQQSYIPHVVAYAACIGNGAKHCQSDVENTTPYKGAAISVYLTLSLSALIYNISHL